MNLKDLNAFVLLSESLHFAKTAEKTNVSPSTLSRMMQRLEAEFGQVFFDRDNRSVFLTPEGERFLAFSMSVIEQWEILVTDFELNSSHLTGQLNIYCTVTAAHIYLPRLVESFRKRHPNVDINLETGDVAVAYQKLEQQSADFAFAVSQSVMPHKFLFHSIDTIPLKLIGPSSITPFSKHLHSTPIDYQLLPFVMPESGPAKAHTKKWLKELCIKPSVYANVVGHEAIVSMVALGCGVAVVPSAVLDLSPAKDKVKILPVPFSPEPFNLGIASLAKRKDSPLIAAFWNLVREVF